MSETEQVQPIEATSARKRWGYSWWMAGVLIVFAVCEGLFFYWGQNATPWAILGLFLAAVFGVMRGFQFMGKTDWRDGLFVILIVLSLLIAFLTPALQASREAARRLQCANHLKQLGLALYNYESAHGCLPPAFMKDEEGRPMHSWRTSILPYLEHEALYNAYDFEKPWNASENQKLASSSELYVWRCPCIPDSPDRPKHRTDYVAVIGDDTLWPTDGTSRSFKDVDAGISNTAILIETNHSDIAWHEPRDITIDDLLSGKFSWTNSGVHPPGVNVFYESTPIGRNIVFGDGAVRYVQSELTEDQIRRLFSIREPFDFDDELLDNGQYSPRPIVFRHVVFYVWLATLLMQLAYAYFPLRYKEV